MRARLTLGVVLAVLMLGAAPGQATDALAATTSTAGPAALSASGEPWKRIGRQKRPTAAPSQWRRVFRDDFDGDALDAARWGSYSGYAKSGGLWRTSHVEVADGVVTLAGYQDPLAGGEWASGGFNNRRGLIQTYGKYRIRMRLDDAYGLSYAVLLWPESNVGPPEVDIVEGFGRSMQRTKATVHSGTPTARVRTGQVNDTVDMSRWHVVGVEWTPDRLVFTIDGKPWWILTGPKVPSAPMLLALQAQIHDCSSSIWACPGSRSPERMNMYVDWVEAYSYQPRR